MPEEDDRRRLWDANLPAPLPQADDIDLDFLARRFKLSGGNIRNICVTAAYLAAAADRPVVDGRPHPRRPSASTASSAA